MLLLLARVVEVDVIILEIVALLQLQGITVEQVLFAFFEMTINAIKRMIQRSASMIITIFHSNGKTGVLENLVVVPSSSPVRLSVAVG